MAPSEPGAYVEWASLSRMPDEGSLTHLKQEHNREPVFLLGNTDPSLTRVCLSSRRQLPAYCGSAILLGANFNSVRDALCLTIEGLLHQLTPFCLAYKGFAD